MRTVIDDRLTIWANSVQANHPALYHGGLARHIVKQCERQPEEAIQAAINEPSPFDKGNELSARRIAQEQREAQKAHDDREILLTVTLDDTLDSFDPEDSTFRESIEFQRHIQFNPGIREEYRKALMYVSRLYIQREQIALWKREKDFGQIHFILVLNRLLDDH